MKSRPILQCAAILLLLFAASTAKATPLTYDFDYEFSGAQQPASPNSPWLQATVSDGGGGDVLVELEVTALTNQEFVSNWYFNMDPNASSFDSNATISGSGWSGNATLSYGVDGFNADGDGYFDFLLAFSDHTFDDVGDTVVLEFHSDGSYTFTTSSFNHPSAPGGGQGSYFMAAHVQGIGDDAEGSGWIGADGGTPVPEPATMALLGSGLVGLAAMARKKK